jgi:hypothetical protein
LEKFQYTGPVSWFQPRKSDQHPEEKLIAPQMTSDWICLHSLQEGETVTSLAPFPARQGLWAQGSSTGNLSEGWEGVALISKTLFT